MSLKAQVSTDSMGNITIHLEGGLDFENSLPFRRELEMLSDDNPLSTLTLDLHSLDFVGSSGIGHFVESIRCVHLKRDQIRLSNVKPEFLKVFKLFKFDPTNYLVDLQDDDAPPAVVRTERRILSA